MELLNKYKKRFLANKKEFLDNIKKIYTKLFSDNNLSETEIEELLISLAVIKKWKLLNNSLKRLKEINKNFFESNLFFEILKNSDCKHNVDESILKSLKSSKPKNVTKHQQNETDSDPFAELLSSAETDKLTNTENNFNTNTENFNTIVESQDEIQTIHKNTNKNDFQSSNNFNTLLESEDNEDGYSGTANYITQKFNTEKTVSIKSKDYQTQKNISLHNEKQTPVFSQRFDIIGKLGEGGMGIVYKAKDKKLNRIVALKSISSKYRSNTKIMIRFLSEARAIAKLNHYNIVMIYDIIETEDETYICMEYIDGIDLSSLVEKKSKFDYEEATGICISIVEGMAEAHNKGIIHRDLKPGNILMKEERIPKITDFGLVKEEKESESQTTMLGAVIGTPGYMSPEQRRDSSRVDKRTDIYAIGAIYYYMLTGDSPAVIKLEGLPRKIKKILSKSLEDNPKNRYQTVEEMSNDLKKILVSKTPLTVDDPKPLNHIKLTVILSIAVIIGGLLFYFIAGQSGNDQAKINEYLDIGIRLCHQGRPDEAVKVLEQYVAKNQFDLQGLYWLGWAYYLMKEDGKALDMFTRAASVDETFALAYKGIGMVYYSKDIFDLSEHNLNRALQLTNDEAEKNKIKQNLAVLFYRKGDYRRSIDLSKEIISNEDIADNYELLCRNYLTVRNYPKVVKYAEEGLKKRAIERSFIHQLHYYAALANANLQEFNKSYEHILKAIELQPNNEDYIKFFNHLKELIDNM